MTLTTAVAEAFRNAEKSVNTASVADIKTYMSSLIEQLGELGFKHLRLGTHAESNYFVLLDHSILLFSGIKKNRNDIHGNMLHISLLRGSDNTAGIELRKGDGVLYQVTAQTGKIEITDVAELPTGYYEWKDRGQAETKIADWLLDLGPEVKEKIARQLHEKWWLSAKRGFQALSESLDAKTAHGSGPAKPMSPPMR